MLVKISVGNTLYFLWDTSSKGVQEAFASGTHSCHQNESKPSIYVIFWMLQNQSGKTWCGRPFKMRWFSGKVWLYFQLLSLCRRRGAWSLLPPAGHPSQEEPRLRVLPWVGSDLRRKRHFSRNDAISPARGIFASRWSRPLVLQRRWLKQSLKGAAPGRLLGRALQPSRSPYLQ